MQLLQSVLLSGSIIDLDGTMLVHFGLFFVAFFILRSLVFKPMIALFEAREEAIDGARLKAKELEKDAGAKGGEFEEKMRELRIKGGEERERLRKEGQQLEQKLLAQVQEDTRKQLEDAEKQMETDASKLRKELDAQIPVLAKQITSKLLQREVS